MRLVLSTGMRPKRDGESSRTGGWVGSGTPRHPRPNHVLFVAVAVSHRVQRRVLYVMLLAGGHDFRSHPSVMDEPCRDQHKQDVAVLRRQYAGGFCRGPKHAVSRYSSEWPCCVQNICWRSKFGALKLESFAKLFSKTFGLDDPRVTFLGTHAYIGLYIHHGRYCGEKEDASRTVWLGRNTISESVWIPRAARPWPACPCALG